MARALKDHSTTLVSGFPLQAILCPSTFGIGTSGAVDNTKTGSNPMRGCTLVNSGTGTFDGTFPPCAQALITPSVQKSAAATVTEVILTALSPTAGTYSIRTSKAGTATNPASGDLIGINLVGSPMGAQ